MQLNVSRNTLPPDMIENALWCCWKYEARDGKPTKLPKNPKTGGNAQSSNPHTFSDFQTAWRAYEQQKYDGLGVGTFPPYAAIDIDHCIENGVVSDMAADIIEIMHSYTEISPSGEGIRIFFKIHDSFVYDTEQYYIMNAKMGFEIYVSGSTKKFCTITGNRMNHYDVSDGTIALPKVLNKYQRKPSQRAT